MGGPKSLLLAEISSNNGRAPVAARLCRDSQQGRKWRQPGPPLEPNEFRVVAVGAALGATLGVNWLLDHRALGVEIPPTLLAHADVIE